MATWPATLPQTPLLNGYENTPQNSVLRSEFDGYTKQRNRFTAVLNDVSESYFLTQTQYDTFKTFFESTLKNGAEEFTKQNPESGVDELYRFVEPYSPSRVGLSWVVECKLEKLP